MAEVQALPKFCSTSDRRDRWSDEPEEIMTPRNCTSGTWDQNRRSHSADNAWRRMRTPSPDAIYSSGGYRGPPQPAETLLKPDRPPGNLYATPSVLVHPPNIIYKPVLCFMAVESSYQSDAETVANSWSDMCSLPSIDSWSSFNGVWTSPASDDGIPEMDSGDAEHVWSYESEVSGDAEHVGSSECEVCEPSPEEKASETSKEVATHTEDVPSRGSVNHPHKCASACKYVKKSRGCKDGADCDRCHLCVFYHTKLKKAAKEEARRKPAEAQEELM